MAAASKKAAMIRIKVVDMELMPPRLSRLVRLSLGVCVRPVMLTSKPLMALMTACCALNPCRVMPMIMATTDDSAMTSAAGFLLNVPTMTISAGRNTTGLIR